MHGGEPPRPEWGCKMAQPERLQQVTMVPRVYIDVLNADWPCMVNLIGQTHTHS